MSLRIVFKSLGDSSAFLGNDRIFLGEGLLETIRVDEGKAYFSESHWRRLRQAADALEIFFDLSLCDWQEKLNEYITLSQLHQGGVKVLLSAGTSARGLAARGSNPCLVFEAFQYQISSEAVKLIRAPWRRDSNNPVYRLKSVNYLEGIMAARHAQKAGANDALFFNFNEHATETTIANLFVMLCMVYVPYPHWIRFYFKISTP